MESIIFYYRNIQLLMSETATHHLLSQGILIMSVSEALGARLTPAQGN